MSTPSDGLDPENPFSCGSVWPRLPQALLRIDPRLTSGLSKAAADAGPLTSLIDIVSDDLATSLAVPIVPRRRLTSARQGLRMTPLIAATAVAAGGLLALFLLIEVQPRAAVAPWVGRSGLTVGALLSPFVPPPVERVAALAIVAPTQQTQRTVIIRANGHAAYEELPSRPARASAAPEPSPLPYVYPGIPGRDAPSKSHVPD